MVFFPLCTFCKENRKMRKKTIFLHPEKKFYFWQNSKLENFFCQSEVIVKNKTFFQGAKNGPFSIMYFS